MKVIERYPMGFRLLRGRGFWAAFYPLRLAVAVAYGLWLLARGDRALRGARDDGARERRQRAVSPGNGRRPMIISIGNLETGGGGKTPCVVALARALMGRGEGVVVVSRGYRSLAARRAPCVVPAGRMMPAAGAVHRTTDEELLGRAAGDARSEAHAADEARIAARAAAVLGDEIILYRSRGIPVVIDGNRRRGISVAGELFSPKYILLDDAYQNHSIDKDAEILLLDAEAPFGDGRLMPLGSLRERPAAAGRADAIIFTRAREERIPGGAERFVRGPRVFFATHGAVEVVNIRGETAPLSFLQGRPCVLFSGIARPGSFEETIRSLGARPRAAFRFIDHHTYVAEDIGAMLGEWVESAVFITTEKDLAKAAALFPAGLDVRALRIEMKVSGLDRLLALIASASS